MGRNGKLVAPDPRTAAAPRQLSHANPTSPAPSGSFLDGEALRAAIADADMQVLLVVLFDITGERRWLDPPFRPRRDVRPVGDPSAGLDAAIQDETRITALAEFLSTHSIESRIAQPVFSTHVEQQHLGRGRAGQLDGRGTFQRDPVAGL